MVELNIKRIEHGENKKLMQQERKMNAARTKNETALCEVCRRESGGTRALVIAQRSMESFFIPTRAADCKGRSGSLAISALMRRKSLSPPKNNLSQVRAAIADEHSTYAWYMNLSITTYNSNNCNSLTKSKLNKCSNYTETRSNSFRLL